MQVLIDSRDSLLASFIYGNEPGRLIFVTGPSGSGKTRWCLALIERAKVLGIHADGLVSLAIFEGDQKISIDLRDLQSGTQRRLAFRRAKSMPGYGTKGWFIDEATLKWGNELLAQPGERPLFILDELGPLELKQGTGLTNGIDLIAARRYQLACVVIRPSLLALAVESWPWGQIFSIPRPNPARVETP